MPPISFNEVPNGIRVPFAYIEFDNSNAQQGPNVQPYTTLLIGQKLAAGTQPELELVTVTSEAQARTLFGAGSVIHAMISKYLQNDGVTELKVMAIDDAGASVAAVGDVTFTGTATKAGTVQLYVSGRRISIPVAVGDDGDAVATACAAAVSAESLSLVSAAVDGVTTNQVNLTARNKGPVGNEIDVRFNYFDDDAFPAGITASVTNVMGGATPGATAPDVSEIIAALPEDQFNVIVNQFTDAANMVLLETELDDRWGPIRQNDGRAFSAKLDTLSNLSTYGNARNSQHTSVMGPAKSAPNSSFEWAAAYGAQAAKNLQIDPARPLQTLELVGILPPAPSERFILSERNILLTDGIATAKISDTEARIERAITTFQTNAAGAPDTSYLDVNTPATLSFLRYDFRLTLLTKFPRHKLASDGVRVAPGQAILTPSAAKAEAIAKFREWQDDLGLVEGFDQFKRDLIVERNASDPNRLDFLMPPDLVNQLRVMGVQFQFLL